MAATRQVAWFVSATPSAVPVNPAPQRSGCCSITLKRPHQVSHRDHSGPMTRVGTSPRSSRGKPAITRWMTRSEAMLHSSLRQNCFVDIMMPQSP